MTGVGMRALAVDIGGTKIAAAVVADDGRMLGRDQFPTPKTGDGDVVFTTVCAAVDGALAAAGLPGFDTDENEYDAVPDSARAGFLTRELGGIGVATAGPVDLTLGTVSPVNICAWRGFPLRDRLAARYGLSVRMFGDGIAIAIAEHWLGAARGVDNFLGMVVSTGVGGGLIQGGRVMFGSGGNAGHIGHISVDPAGPVCPCGGIGCLETIASGTSLAKWYAGQSADLTAANVVATDVTASDLADAARAGDVLAQAAFTRAATAVGMAIAGAVTLLDLDRVVIGGGVAKAFDLLREPLNAAYQKYAGLGFAHSPRVVVAELGGDVGLLGAAAVVLHPDRYWPIPAEGGQRNRTGAGKI
ncbi:MAG: ROK family protein [Nakamurella sp.]